MINPFYTVQNSLVDFCTIVLDTTAQCPCSIAFHACFAQVPFLGTSRIRTFSHYIQGIIYEKYLINLHDHSLPKLFDCFDQEQVFFEEITSNGTVLVIFI